MSEVQPVEVAVVSVAADGTPGTSVPRHAAHQPPGVLHQAVSVQVVDADGRWLLQRRAPAKALFAGCWSNTCCTHPAPGEQPVRAATRRLHQELGLTVTDLVDAGVFTYRATDPQSGLVECEQDHVFAAVAELGELTPDPGEISEVARLPFDEALALACSEDGTPWAAEVLRRAFEALAGR